VHDLAARCGRWSAAHWKTAVALWLVLVALLLVTGNLVGGRELAEGEAGSGESGEAQRIRAGAGFDERAGESVLVSRATPPSAVDQPALRAVLADLSATLAATEGVQAVQSPLDGGEAAAGLVGADGRAALVRFELAGDPDDAAETVAPSLAAVAALRAEHPGWAFDQFGQGSAEREFNATIDGDFQRAELLSVPVSLVVLVLAFGALVAAAVPVVLAATAVVATFGLSALVSHVFPTTDVTGSVILLIGMAVGVDYSLFYLRREREEAAAGRDRLGAIARAAATSGQAVLVSGATVVIAMAGMLLAGDAVFTSIGVGTILVVVMAVAGSVTVLPALLAGLGRKVDAGRIPLLGRRRREGPGGGGRFWPALLRPVLARPAPSAAAAALVLLLLAVPALSMRTALPSLADLPGDLPVVRAYERIQAAFPGATEPAVVVVEAPDVRTGEAAAAIEALGERAAAEPSLGAPLAVQVNPAGTVALVRIPMAGKGDDAASKAALATLRERVVPATVGALPGVTAAVTGQTAGTVDFNDQLKARAPLVFAFVLGLAFVLLLVSFRSLVVPLKAMVLNLLGVAASYGVLVAVFQWGWGAWLVGAEPGTAITSWLPLFLFVILFGLSMDYHVFILSRVRELVDAGVPTRRAVATAIEATAGTVTSAAAVMVAVFAIFATLSMVDVKQLGVGLAVAITLDATVIRAILLPATMELLGDWNWYLPRWLGWLARRRPAAPVPAATGPAPELVRR
jgi:uncharacterized membrane protein YdfJ with MMPL/SSD domain